MDGSGTLASGRALLGPDARPRAKLYDYPPNPDGKMHFSYLNHKMQEQVHPGVFLLLGSRHDTHSADMPCWRSPRTYGYNKAHHILRHTLARLLTLKLTSFYEVTLDA